MSMNCPIRRVEISEIDKALSLVWEVFLKYEAPDYSEEGIRTFDQIWYSIYTYGIPDLGKRNLVIYN